MSRIVPVYIDLESNKYAVLASEINENLKVYKVSVETASDTWILTHNENTVNVLVKVYVAGEEIIPDSVFINDSLRITVSFSTPVAGELHIFMFNFGQFVAPTPTVTPNPTFTPTPSITPSITPSAAPAGLLSLHSTGITSLDDVYYDTYVDISEGLTYACGATEDAVNGQQPLFTVFNTANGNVINTTTYATGFSGSFNGITKIGDFVYCVGWVLAGGTNIHAVVVKFNVSGGVVWQRGFKTTASEFVEFTAITDNNELGSDYIYISGYADSATRRDGVLVKFDTDGNRIWQQRVYTGATDRSNTFNSIHAFDGQIVVSGRKEQSNTEVYNGLVATVANATGLLFQTYEIENTGTESASYYDLYADSTHYYAVGVSDDNSIIHKIERSSGTIAWAKSIPLSFIEGITIRGAELVVVGQATVSGTTNGAIHYINSVDGSAIRSSHLMYHTDGGGKEIIYYDVYISPSDRIHAAGSANDSTNVRTETAVFTAEAAGVDVGGAGVTLPQFVIKREIPTVNNDNVNSSTTGFTTFDVTDTFFTLNSISYLTNTLTFIDITTTFMGIAVPLTPSATATPTPTGSPGPSQTPTVTPTFTPTITATITPNVTPTITPSVTATVTPTPTNTPGVTSTVTPTVTPTISVSPTPTVTPTNTPGVTATVTPTVTPTISITPTITATVTPTVSVSPTPTVTPTSTSGATPTVTPSPSDPVGQGAISLYEPQGSDLYQYQFDGTDWAQASIDQVLVSNGHDGDIAAMQDDTVAFIERLNDELKTLNYGGTTWGQVNNAAAVTAISTNRYSIAMLDGTTMALADSENDFLKTYTWDGTDWTQTGSTFNFPFGTADVSICAMTTTRIAFITNNDGRLRVFDWNGSVWSEHSNNVLPAGFGAIGFADLSALDSTTLAFSIGKDAPNQLGTIVYAGTSWTLSGSIFNLTTLFGLSGSSNSNIHTQIVALDSSNIAISTTSNNTLTKMNWNGSAWSIVGNTFTLPISTAQHRTTAMKFSASFDPNTAGPQPSATPTPTPTVTPTVSVSPSATPNVTATVTPTITPSTVAVTNQGFIGGGGQNVGVLAFPFAAPFTVANNVGDLVAADDDPFGMAGHSDSSGGQGFASGGYRGGYIASVLKFPFSSPFTTATQVGDIADGGGNNTMGYQIGSQDSSDGFLTGGYGGGYFGNIYKFPFAAPFAGDITYGTGRANLSFSAGVTDTTDWYSAGGYGPASGNPSNTGSIIVRYPFVTPFSTFISIGDLSSVRWGGAGHNSPSSGYVSGGSNNPGFAATTIVDSFPFASPFATATLVGNLTIAKRYASGLSSTTDGISASSASNGPPVATYNRVDKFPFASPFTSTVDVGDLSTNPLFVGLEAGFGISA